MSAPIERHVVMFSGGAGSWAAARRVAAKHGTDNLWLVFADTLVEDADCYRFLVEAAANIYRCAGQLDGLISRAAQVPPSSRPDDRRAWLAALRRDLAPIMPRFVWLCEGRTIWEVFEDESFLGNSRAGICTRTLKQEPAGRWLSEHCDPATTTAYVGIDWTEEHRYTGDSDEDIARKVAAGKRPRLGLKRIRAAQGWHYEAPLCGPPYVTKADVLAELARLGIPTPRLYRLGFAHNNCGGGCVKAGIGHFAHLHRALPAMFAEWEHHEEALRSQLGDVSMLRDRTDGVASPLPLTELRRRLNAGYQPDLFDIGGCGCFSDEESVEAALAPAVTP